MTLVRGAKVQAYYTAVQHGPAFLPHWAVPERLIAGSFAAYCQAYARYKEAEEFITQHGSIVKTPSGYWQQVPQVAQAQTYSKIMLRLAEQFGLTPSARSRIIAGGGDSAPADEMEELLGGGS